MDLQLGILFSALLATGTNLAGPDEAGARAVESLRSLPLHFEPNLGQFDCRVKFLTRAGGYTLYLADEEAVIDARQAEGGCVVKMRFTGSRPAPCMEGLEELHGKSHYFKGSDPERWVRNVPHFARVRIEEVYPGIDIEYYGTVSQTLREGRRLEFDFVVGPGAEPEKIELDFEGVEAVTLDAEGRAVLALSGEGQIVFERPLAYQETGGRRIPVPSDYVQRGRFRLGLSLRAYDRTQPLRIDPTLGYSTFLGGSGGDAALGIALDSNGKAYVTGSTPDAATDYPTTGGAYDTTHNGGTYDAFVTKLSADGSSLDYSTFLGGNGVDFGYGIAVDSNSKAYVAGFTQDSTTDYLYLG